MKTQAKSFDLRLVVIKLHPPPATAGQVAAAPPESIPGLPSERSSKESTKSISITEMQKEVSLRGHGCWLDSNNACGDLSVAALTATGAA
ncbi:hypothetical protein PCASD_26014 [Puccinia coronata f. sp. avenae]|uniref:Uncharacterized protein n=1 Tax=Puccinia coronata f. sp. avenae TaxID=200324 RepID=A0A2N5TM97_9BASI|nr:hypothetical protein PCASD_26014 [Puccinia coronata f. sp. avenae]